VLLLPEIVMVLLTTGNPVKSVPCTLVRVWMLLLANTRVSAPLPAMQPPVAMSVLPAVMASIKSQFTPSTLMVAASAGAWPSAQRSASPPSESRHCRCKARRSLRGSRTSPW
jgi:hypothetical protein